MNCNLLYECILNAYKIYEIKSFPVDCFEIIRKHGFKIVKYSELSSTKEAACRKLSDDACLIEDNLYYDENVHPRRIAFSIAHELGHHFLRTNNEDDADEFASHFLAPRILIHKYNLRNADQIRDTFGLSYAASNRALMSYREWYREISRRTPRQPADAEQQLEQIFFPKKEIPTLTTSDSKDDIVYDSFTDRYLYVLRALRADLPIPDEYKKDLALCRKLGLKLV